MTPERQRRKEGIFRSALQRPAEERAAFLDEVCGDDESLRKEVESLLAADDGSGGVFDSPVNAGTPKHLLDVRAELLVGQRIGHYKIQGLLGSGGMGEVFLASDEQLGRNVAIKLLPPHLMSDDSLVHRFRREARAASSLNHPNILTIHEIGEAGGTHFISMEFVEGETLRSRLKRTRIKLSETLDIAFQIASALAAAHQAGVVHRDIKPENIMLRRDRLVKVLDFGLAKLTEQHGFRQQVDTEASTDVLVKTSSGVVMGTVKYMSPEQAQGSDLDARTDVWSLGCVLYEMITGHSPFDGPTASHIIVSILEKDPAPLANYSVEVPPELLRILRKALEKDREERYQTMKDMALDLKSLRQELDLRPERDLTTTNTAGVAASVKPHRRGLFAALVLGSLAILVLMPAVLVWRMDQPELGWRNPLAGAQFTLLTDFPGAEGDATISRDGKFVSFLSDRDGPFDIWVGQIGTGQFTNLTKGKIEDMRNPEVRGLGFSPDGSLVSFWVRVENRPSLWVVPTMGGTPREYFEAPELDWSPDGTRLVYHTNADGDPIFVTPPNEQVGKQIYTAERGVHCHFPIWSPDGAFIYFVQGFPPDEMDIWRIRSTGGPAERITSHTSLVSHPTFVNEKTLLYVARADDGTGPWLYGLDVDQRLPHRVSLGVEQYSSIAATADGRTLIATVANPEASLWKVSVMDKAAEEDAAERVLLPTVRALSPRITGSDLVYLSSKGGNDGIWKLVDGEALELWSGRLGRIIEGPAVSPDGRRIAFTARKAGRNKLYLMNSNGTGITELANSVSIRGAPAWPPVGEWLTVAAEQDNRPGLFNIPLDGGPPVPLVQGQATNPVWSPDGHFLVYSGVEVGTIFSLKAVSADGQRYNIPEIVLSRGANRFSFFPGRSQLIVLKGEFWHRSLWLVDLETGQQRQLTNFSREFLINDFDISPDGKDIIFSRLRENTNVVLIEFPEQQ